MYSVSWEAVWIFNAHKQAIVQELFAEILHTILNNKYSGESYNLFVDNLPAVIKDELVEYIKQYESFSNLKELCLNNNSSFTGCVKLNGSVTTAKSCVLMQDKVLCNDLASVYTIAL